ncbi:MAG: hypothetical protein KKB50_11385 [Planctomycetes bacterium]|nr:hypothetical protein [Planctomycetota bacterium]
MRLTNRYPGPASCCWLGSVVLLTLLPEAAGANRPDESVARYVPREAGLFVEARGADDLLVSLTEPDIWITLAELAGQPARPEDAREWRSRIRDTIGMEPVEAIRLLFSQRVAFVGEGPGRAQDAVVLCRPRAELPIADLLQHWRAQPLPDMPGGEVYRLRHNVGLAVRDGLLIFGDVAARAGMFHQTVAAAGPASDQETLAKDPTFQELLARVPADPDGILFARLNPNWPRFIPTSQPASQPTSSLPSTASPPVPEPPGPLRGASNVLLALHRDRALLHFSVVGDGHVGVPAKAMELTRYVSKLPAHTLLAWSGWVDFPALVQAIETLPERNVLRMAVMLQGRDGAAQRMLTGMDGPICVAFGCVSPGGRPATAPPVPAGGLLLAARQPAAVEREFAKLVDYSQSIYNLLSLKRGMPGLEPIRSTTVAGTAVRVLDLSPLIAGRDHGAVGEVHLCWAVDGDLLIIASHIDWLREIMLARRGATPGLAPVLDLVRRAPTRDTEAIFVAQVGPIADLGRQWLTYFEHTAAHVLEEQYWREHQPGGQRTRLGITVTPNIEQRHLRVVTVDERMPAAGFLKVGDEIIGCNGRRFATTQPISEIVESIERSNHPRWVDVEISRGEDTLPRRIPMPFVDPVQALRRAIAIGQFAQRVVYHEDFTDPAGARGFLTVELRSSASPLFDFNPASTPQPVGADPRSQP